MHAVQDGGGRGRGSGERRRTVVKRAGWNGQECAEDPGMRRIKLDRSTECPISRLKEEKVAARFVGG